MWKFTDFGALVSQGLQAQAELSSGQDPVQDLTSSFQPKTKSCGFQPSESLILQRVGEA